MTKSRKEQNRRRKKVGAGEVQNPAKGNGHRQVPRAKERARSVGHCPGHVRQVRPRDDASPATKSLRGGPGRDRATRNRRTKSHRDVHDRRNVPATRSRLASHGHVRETGNRVDPDLGRTTGSLTGPVLGHVTVRVDVLVLVHPIDVADQALGVEQVGDVTAFRRTRAVVRRAKSRPSPEIENVVDDRGLDVVIEPV